MYLLAVELLAEGAGSVGWNLGNGGVGQHLMPLTWASPTGVTAPLGENFS